MISLVNHFNKFTTAGMIVVPVCDGHVRPTAKQATNVRIASREKTRITALQLRSRIREIKDKLSNVEGSESVSLRLELEKELATAEKRVKQNETKSKDIVPPNFDIALANELRTRNAHNIDGESAGGYIDYVAVAEFQADSYMLGQLINNDAIMAMTKDTDIPILAGDCGMVINEFTKNKYQIVGTSESTLKFAMSLLPPKSGAKFKPALKPIFDGVQCPRLRSLMMVILGCDVYVSGMVGVSAAKLSTMIDTKKLEFAETFTEELLYSSLRQELMDKNQLSSEVVDTYINAIMYEPTNKTKTTGVNDEATNVEDEMTTASHLERSYLFGAPSSLPKYLEQFSIDDEFLRNNIIDGPGISLCKGVGDRSHQFLTDEGSRSCAHCGELTCVHCCEKADGDGKVDCLPCYATNALIPLAGCDGSKTIAEMRRELKDQFNFDHVDQLKLDEVEEAYEKMEFVRAYKNREEQVPFPVYCSSHIDHPSQWSTIADVELQYGAAFLSHPDITTDYIPGILNLFGSLVTYESTNQSGWMKKISDTMPAVLVKFASSCRLGCGYRLLMRCARHAFDSKMPPIDREMSKLIIHNGEIGIHLVSNVPASMKSDVYRTEIVATPTKILCCRCTCQCGSQDNERILCVHNLPLLLKLSVFIGECLGEHLLLEFTACWNSAAWEKAAWSDSELNSMKRNILLLMVADDPSFDSMSKVALTIDKLLDKYKVGTDGEKKWQKRTHIPPKPSDLCPIYKLPLQSTTKLLEIGLKHETNSNEKRSIHSTVDSHEHALFEPNYVQVSLLMNASGCNDTEDLYECAGFQLLRYRANDTETKLSGSLDIGTLTTKVENDWKELRRLSRKRSHNGSGGSAKASQKRRLVTPTPRLAKTPAKSALKTTNKHTPLSSHRPRNLFQQNNHQTMSKEAANKRPANMAVEEDAPPRKRRASMICAKCGRNNSPRSVATGNDVRFFSVPTFPAPLKAPTLDTFIKREGRILLHRYVMDRVGCSKECTNKKYICENHNFEWIKRSRKITWDEEEYTQEYLMLVPEAEGKKSSTIDATTVSKGVGRDRALHRLLHENLTSNVIHHSESLTIDDCDALISDLQTQTPKNMEDKLRIAEEITTVMAAKAERLASELAQSNAVIQQMAEKDIDDNIPINPNLLHSMGVHVSRGNADEMRVEGKPFFHVKPIEGRAASTIQRRKAITTDDPIVDLSISDKEVMRRTGFSSLSALLAYVFIVSNSDIDRILQRKSSLTWFEEWFLHFEYNYGRTLTRYDDVEAVFGVRRPDAVDVVNHKYDIEYCALESWPPYAFHEEDMALRCKDKWAQYNNSRPIMWDMTNVSAYQFTDSDLQRLTFSEYYGECCFKGGVFTQLMGWQGVADLWTGRITDTDYTKREGYLTRQREFQERDKVKVDGEEIVLPFINIYDKGFRVNTAAWSEGQQLVLQPDFAKSDRRFSRHQTMSSASVASDRGANERTVNVSKRAGYIKRGLRPHMCPINYHKAWKTSAFKANFMYKPVL